MVTEGTVTWATQDEFWRYYEVFFWFALISIQLFSFLAFVIWNRSNEYKEGYRFDTYWERGTGINRERI